MSSVCFCFFFNDTATTDIYTLSLHDALPILSSRRSARRTVFFSRRAIRLELDACGRPIPRLPRSTAIFVESSATTSPRSEEHTSELQSQFHLVCRLLLEKKKSFKAICMLWMV